MALDLGAKLCSNHDLVNFKTTFFVDSVTRTSLSSFQMLFTDVDILFGVSGLTSIRLLASEGQSVYFPIVFSTFKNSAENFHKDGSGYWRHFGYG
jgi:hypothetical protein